MFYCSPRHQLCEIHTVRNAKNFYVPTLPCLLGCLVTCGTVCILHNPTAQVDDSSDTRPLHIDAKGQGS